MATATADAPLEMMVGNRSDVPIIASDIVYEGSMVGDNGSGYGRPLVAGDPFRGHAYEQCANSAGSAGDKNIRVTGSGKDAQILIEEFRMRISRTLTPESLKILDQGRD